MKNEINWWTHKKALHSFVMEPTEVKEIRLKRSTFVSRKMSEASGHVLPIEIPFTSRAQIFVRQHINRKGC
jgi:hypothetical protein